MIKRRSIRIKVFQALYGYEHSNGEPVNNFSKQLKERIYSINEIYIFHLLMIQQIGDAFEEEAKRIANKHIKQEKDNEFKDKFLSNIIYKYLVHDEEFQSLVKKFKLKSKLDDAIIQKFYKTFKTSENYLAYAASSETFNTKEDVDICKYLFKDIFLQSDDYHNYIQDIWSNWIDDAHLISSSVSSTFEKSKSKLKLAINRANYGDKIKELVTFGESLLEQTINNKENHLELIASRLKNWDVKRLPSTDILIIRMAISELLYFPSIPTKVTINEYIDIAKEYSTPKSKEFVNGIIDNLAKDLKLKGLIVKEGRGLKESS